MIKNQWYCILESSEIKNKPIGVLRLGLRLVIFRDSKGNVVCISDICAHRGASLSLGKIINGAIQCPFHGLEFVVDGRCRFIPANGRISPVSESMKVKAYPCREIHDFIFIYYAEEIPTEIPEPDFFEDISEEMYHSTEREHWNTHYTRAIENQLDVAHLPFVHHNTIGRGNKTLVDGPGMEWLSEKWMQIYTYNRIDDGTPAKKPDEVEVPNPKNEFKLELILPNLWQNYISKKMRIVAAFAPVDEENTVIYFRIYQSVVRLPLLKNIFTWLNKRYAHIIAFQDKRVVETQTPKKPELQGEHLFTADKPIVEFRKKRKELMEISSKL